jgi:hypothetical protein
VVVAAVGFGPTGAHPRVAQGRTPSGHTGGQGVPFWRAECSPPMSVRCALLGGSNSMYHRETARQPQPSSRLVTPKMRSRSSTGGGPSYMRTVLNTGALPCPAAITRPAPSALDPRARQQRRNHDRACLEP